MSMSNNRIIDLNRKRASISYTNIASIEDENERNNTCGLCRKIPTLIKVNGFLNTLCFIKGKKDNEYKKIYNWIKEWFVEIGYCEENDSLIKVLMECENKEYYLFTKEAIEILIWYKRNAEAMIL